MAMDIELYAKQIEGSSFTFKGKEFTSCVIHIPIASCVFDNIQEVANYRSMFFQTEPQFAAWFDNCRLYRELIKENELNPLAVEGYEWQVDNLKRLIELNSPIDFGRHTINPHNYNTYLSNEALNVMGVAANAGKELVDYTFNVIPLMIYSHLLQLPEIITTFEVQYKIGE